MQQHCRNEASTYNQSSDNARAISNPDALEHRREPEITISCYSFQKLAIRSTYQKGPMNPHVERIKLINTPTLPASWGYISTA